MQEKVIKYNIINWEELEKKFGLKKITSVIVDYNNQSLRIYSGELELD